MDFGIIFFSNRMREIEIKIRVNPVRSEATKEVKDMMVLANKLSEMGCVFSEPVRQHDINYTLKGSRNEFKGAEEGDIMMRIRREEGRTELNLKQQRSGESDNLEYETEVSDAEQVHQMLLLLNWYPTVEVKKTRQKGKLGEYSICLDRVEQLGDFMEIEKLVGEGADPAEVREELFGVLAKLGFTPADEETRGYDTQIYNLHHA